MADRDTTLSSGTSIDENGKLTTGEDQEGQLEVTATVSYESPTGEDDEDGTPITEVKTLKGESVVTVTPLVE